MITITLVVIGLIVIGLAVGGFGMRVMPSGQRLFPRVARPPDTRSLLRLLGVGSVTWFACALATLPLWWLAYRLPLIHQRAWRALSLQSIAVAALLLATSVVHYSVTYHGATLAPSFSQFFPTAIAANAVPMLAVAALVNALEVRRRAVRGAVESQRLRAELAESRLAAVTTQLQPHFLFNTLQSISTLIHRDPVAADAMLAKLSDLLRDVLRRSRSVLVSLEDELRMTETYLELARLRFGDRLQVTMDVDDGVRGAVVPILLLQPLIENAIKHGIGPRAAGGQVGVSARRQDGRLTIVVWDDGVGLGERSGDGTGTGLANTRERLRHAFGDDQTVDLRARAGGGTEVTIRMPLRAEASPSE